MPVGHCPLCPSPICLYFIVMEVQLVSLTSFSLFRSIRGMNSPYHTEGDYVNCGNIQSTITIFNGVIARLALRGVKSTKSRPLCMVVRRLGNNCLISMLYFFFCCVCDCDR